MIDDGRIEGAYPQIYEAVSEIQSKAVDGVETFCVQRMLGLNIDPDVVKLQAMEIQRLRALLQKYDWVPVSERLPETTIADRYSEDVLTALKWYDGDITYSVGWYNSMTKTWNEDAENCKVVAWMPLPEPYRGNEYEPRNSI